MFFFFLHRYRSILYCGESFSITKRLDLKFIIWKNVMGRKNEPVWRRIVVNLFPLFLFQRRRNKKKMDFDILIWRQNREIISLVFFSSSSSSTNFIAYTLFELWFLKEKRRQGFDYKFFFSFSLILQTKEIKE